MNPGGPRCLSTLPAPVSPKRTLPVGELMLMPGWYEAEPGPHPEALTEISSPLSSCTEWHPAGPEEGSTPRTPPPRPPPSHPQGEALTGITRSRQMLKFFLWLDFSFLSENRVSPINSLWPNLSSSQTEILRSPKRVGREKRAYSELSLCSESCDGCWQRHSGTLTSYLLSKRPDVC